MLTKKIISRLLAAQLGFVMVFFLTSCSVNGHWKRETPSRPILSLDKETADLAEVTADALDLAGQVGKENVLMVFDLDNTLLAMEQGLGADQWYEWQKDLATNDPCDLRNVGSRLAVQGALFFASAMRPTQDDAASQVRIIQEKGIPVMVLTSRGADNRLQTFRELRRGGFSFTDSAIGPPGGYDQSFIPVDNGRLSRFEDGVFMTAGQHKGQMLDALLQKTATPMPAVIVMADDKQKNLDAVKQTFAALDIPVHSWRYNGEDENVKNFDSDKANAQWRSIEHALRQVQLVLGPDNYDLGSAVRPTECH